MSFLFHILLGGIAGWLAGKLMKGDGYGVFVDIILGLIGGWVGGWILKLVGLHKEDSNILYFVAALIGAVLLVWIGRLIKGNKSASV